MARSHSRLVRNWILSFGSLAIILVVYGGFVRLTRSGLSIVEWNPVSGAVPPLSNEAWQAEFGKYQQTPEYLQINRAMTVDQYKEIFLIEWLHRLLARLAGLVFAVPCLFLVITGRIPRQDYAVIVAIGMLFVAQAVMGWVMVSSGLEDRPSVSHYLLAAHLFLALALIGISEWTALGYHYGPPEPGIRAPWSTPARVTLTAAMALLLQIAYGAFTAGLRGGLVSNTWPTMLGRLVPQGLLSQQGSPALSLVAAPLTVAFIHRWLAFAALAPAIAACFLIDRVTPTSEIRIAARTGILLMALQVGLGILVVISGVDMALALLHQFNAICLFLTAVFLLHRLRALDYESMRRRGLA